MKLNTRQYTTLFLALASFILLLCIFRWADYLTDNQYIRLTEQFQSAIQERNDGSTSHTVNLPLTTTYSCQNMCGPNAKCSITGEQCTADVDCSGCQPYTPPSNAESVPVPGNNDAGKLTLGVTPTYSPLTSGYGTHETVITSNMYSKPAMANFGVNVWQGPSNEIKSLFDKRYKPPQMQNMPTYPERYTLSGQFTEDGPFASNATLP